MLLIIAILVVSTARALVVKKATTVENPDRPPLTVAMSIFNRVVWPNMTDAWPCLPPDIQRTIPLARAEKFDSHNNHVYPFRSRLCTIRPRACLT